MNSYCISDQNLCLQTNTLFMDIIILAESCALDLEYNRKENEAETLRQNVINIFQKSLNWRSKVTSQKLKKKH